MSSRPCKACNHGPLLEQFSCDACLSQAGGNSYDLCVDCSGNGAREAHTGRRGESHQFQLYRVRRKCDACEDEINTDFLMCIACRQDSDCYDLCLSCVLGKDAIEQHKVMTSADHAFRQVTMQTHIPLKPAQEFKTTEKWWCNICTQEIRPERPFFHCLGCGTGSAGFDICTSCADVGGLFRHGTAPLHRFLHVKALYKPIPAPSQPSPVTVPPLPPRNLQPGDLPPPYMPPASTNYQSYNSTVYTASLSSSYR